jgi:hypothetical protein
MRTLQYRVKVHGHAFFLEHPGSAYMRNAENVDWADIVGLRRGSGVTFRGQPNRENYFHVSIPTFSGLPLYNTDLQATEESSSKWYSAAFTYQLNGPAQIFHLGFFDGNHRFHEVNGRPNIGLVSGRQVVIPIGSRRVPRVGFGLSLGVYFGQPDSSITFEGIDAVFETTFFERSDPRP